MDLHASKQRITDLINRALVVAERQARKDHADEQLYAATVYAASGFNSIGIAVNTVECLDRISGKLRQAGVLPATDHPELYPQVNACEWEYFSSNSHVEEVERLIEQLYDDCYEHGGDDGEYYELFTAAITDGIVAYRNVLPTDHGMLLGLQFSDPDVDELALIEQVSAAVNSQEWHARVRTSCREQLSELLQ